MILTEKNPFYGPPSPITEMTVEQDLKLKLMYDALIKPTTTKEDIITILMSLQHQNFILSNSMMNLVKKWPKPSTQDPLTTSEDPSRPGILYGLQI